MTLDSPRTWLITGASRGLGRAFAEVALEAGDSVVATARKPEQVKDLVDAHPGRALALGLDVTDRAGVLQVVAEAAEFTGRLDVLVNNAGYGLGGAVWSGSDEHAVKVARRIRTGQIDINGGPFNGSAPFGGYKQSGNGRENGIYGFEEFLEFKSMQFKPSAG